MGSTICTAGFPSPAIASGCFTALCASIWYGFFIATLLFSAKENCSQPIKRPRAGSRYFLRSTGHSPNAAGDEELAAQLSEVQAASEQIKSQHIRAGFRLTELLRDALPKDIEVPDNREMQLDLVFGKVWIVKVEDIDEATTQCNRWLVN